MISLSIIREHPDIVMDGIKKKGSTVTVSEIIDLDEKNRELQHQINEMRAERNRASEAIGISKHQGEKADEAIASMRALGD